MDGVKEVHDEKGFTEGIEAPGEHGDSPGADEQIHLLRRNVVPLPLELQLRPHVVGQETGAAGQYRPREVPLVRLHEPRNRGEERGP